uniref:Contactin-associated protein-like 2 n=1 Tax=Petromyzon marinus TaxID=7757 RepID=A0AAJ7T802_PETMA|nr:contactin-associated protein-like 2 [Petromyzon marinus]
MRWTRGALLGLWALFAGARPAPAASPGDSCEEALLPTAFSASSELTAAHAPSYARLNRREGAGGWAPAAGDPAPWLQLDLGSRVRVTGVATQGRYGSSEWVQRYQLLYSDGAGNWRRYQRDDNLWGFSGNENADSVVRHELPRPLVTRFLRFELPGGGAPGDAAGGQAGDAGGRPGLRVAVYGCQYNSSVAYLDGRSLLSLRFAKKTERTIKDVVALHFKTGASDGVLLHGEGQQGDYLTLALHRGRLQLHINLGSSASRGVSGHTLVSAGNLLDDEHWHAVSVHRHGRYVNLTVDRHSRHARTNGDFDYLDLDFQVSFGGMPGAGKSGPSANRFFRGCLENVMYNGVNVIDLAQRKKPAVHVTGNVTSRCLDPGSTAVTFPRPGSWLRLDAPPGLASLSFSLELRTWQERALLLHLPLGGTAGAGGGGAAGGGSLSVVLADGQVSVSVRQARRTNVHITAGSAVNDGQWHLVLVEARRNFLSLVLDGEPSTAMHSNSQLDILTGDHCYLGGCPDATSCPVATLPPSFLGCVRSIVVHQREVDLRLLERGVLGNHSHLQVDTCGILDRCLPDHCEHGGRCAQTWDSFSCQCEGTGYTGTTCHRSVHERSCEAYKQLGRSSGLYSIDTDGSGPLGPVRVFCNITEDAVWTTLPATPRGATAAAEAAAVAAAAVTVSGSSPERPHVARFSYNATAEQLAAVAAQAESCEQQVDYSCRRSRLLNSPEGPPMVWWVARSGERQSYWGGSSPGVHKCACGIERNCTQPRVHCNCDADLPVWQRDSGLLTYKEHLPLQQLVIADTNRTNSAASYRVGPLRCHGDKGLWNAALFTSQSAYLLFPTFRGETNADISFFFKTSASHGIFLENLGLQHFMRIQLKSPQEVSFAFDVGDGPVEVTASSPRPLNDNQWHGVRAERSVKQASLQVDALPARSFQAPAHGHTRLLLNSKLFVGASASGQRGFLGCLRALHMNGVALALEERARVTEGVEPGCTGHCSSYGVLCRNRGRCVERYNGYSCDCTHTPFHGPFCKQEVGAFFEMGTQVRYSFPEPGLAADPLGWHQPQQPPPPLSGGELPGEPGEGSWPGAGLGVEPGGPRALWVQHDARARRAPPRELVRPRRVPRRSPASRRCSLTARSLHVRLGFGTTEESTTSVAVDVRNLANGQPHLLNVTRLGADLYVQLDHYPAVRHVLAVVAPIQMTSPRELYLGRVQDSGDVDAEVLRANAPGFSGCLSRVEFNGAAPLKAALRATPPPWVTVRGRLLQSGCGAVPLTVPPASSSTQPWAHGLDGINGAGDGERVSKGNSTRSAIIGGVIAAVCFALLASLALLARCLLRHKGTYHTHEVKGSDTADHVDSAIMDHDPAFSEPIEESKKEWFI